MSLTCVFPLLLTLDLPQSESQHWYITRISSIIVITLSRILPVMPFFFSALESYIKLLCFLWSVSQHFLINHDPDSFE